MGSQPVTAWQRNILQHNELLRLMRASRFRRFQRSVGEEGWRFLCGTAALLDDQPERAIALLSGCSERPEVLLNLALAWRAAGEDGLGRRTMARAEEMAPALVRAHLEPLAPPFSLTYLLPHLGNTGAMRVIIEQMKGLARRGHKVRALYLAYAGVVPDSRFADNCVEVIPVPPAADFTVHITPSDFVVAGFWDQLFVAWEAAAGFPVYLAQGDSWIFAPDQSPSGEVGLLRDLHLLPMAIISVSSFLTAAIKHLAGRRATVINPGLDLETFDQLSILDPLEGMQRGGKPRIVLVAPDGPGLEFKGVGDILAALAILRDRGFDFEPLWITPTAPVRFFPGQVVVNPPRRKLAKLLASADVYVCGSHYEAFPLPPLEAMAAGTAVVSTKNGGIEEYAVDGWNCLLVPPGNPARLADSMAHLLTTPALRAALVEHGRETVRRFSWKASLDHLETFISALVSRPRPVLHPPCWRELAGGQGV